jgi:hypothetical protein
MTFRVSAHKATMPIFAECPREETALGIALDYLDRGYSAVQIENTKTGAAFGSQFLLAYALARAQEDVLDGEALGPTARINASSGP